MAFRPQLQRGDPPTTPRLPSYSTEDPLAVVMAWHNDNHTEPWWWCSHELCDRIRGRDNRR